MRQLVAFNLLKKHIQIMIWFITPVGVPHFVCAQEKLKAVGGGNEAQMQQAMVEAQAQMAARMRESDAAWKKQLVESKAEVERTASQVEQVRRCDSFKLPMAASSP